MIFDFRFPKDSREVLPIHGVQHKDRKSQIKNAPAGRQGLTHICLYFRCGLGMRLISARSSASASYQSWCSVPMGRPRLHHFSYARMAIFSCGRCIVCCVVVEVVTALVDMNCPSLSKNWGTIPDRAAIAPHARRVRKYFRENCKIDKPCHDTA